MVKPNLQGGDNDYNRSFYKLIFGYIKDGDKLLNLGCGINFNFEKTLAQVRQVEIVSCDVISPAAKPDFVEEFIQQSVEEEFILDKKFDVVSFFELIEHIDKTDELLKNCFNNLKPGGYLIFSFPNLASIYARLELLLGYQPHILEVSNEEPSFGTGIFGKLNNNTGETLHHVRGITYRAMKEMINHHGFKIIKTFGYEYRFKKLLYLFPAIAPIDIFICQKNI